MIPKIVEFVVSYADFRRCIAGGFCICVCLVIVFNALYAPDSMRSLFQPRHIDDRLRVIHQELSRMKKSLEDKKRAMSLVEYSQQAGNKKRKVILCFTEFFNEKPWGWMKDTWMFNHWEGIACPYFDCRLTFDNREFKSADAVIFHAKDMPGRVEMYKLSRQKPKAQKWVYFALESPEYNPDNKWLDNLFHWTLTYRRDSHFFSPYGYYYRVSGGVKNAAQTIAKIVNRKDRFIMWAASHCSLPRERFIKQLQKYIPIDIYGVCAERMGLKSAGTCKMNTPECTELKKRYKFQLGFENSNCLDYVTEKYWSALKLGIVPIVIGGSSYNADMAVPGSFVNAMNFTSVKSLADHLIYLYRNDQEYKTYHYWRKEYRVSRFAPWTCTLCAALNINYKQTYIGNLHDFWNIGKQCGLTDKRIEKIVDSDMALYPTKKVHHEKVRDKSSNK